MELFLNNLTFHNCPVELREKAAFSGEQRHSILRQIHAEEEISEAVILQTCNRLEFYLYAKKSFDCGKFLTELIGQIKPDAVETWSKYSREVTGIDVARHLFEVASGLDSQMLGENQRHDQWFLNPIRDFIEGGGIRTPARPAKQVTALLL